MAIIKTIRYPTNISSMMEDPTPGSNNLFFQTDLYAKDTLAPQYDQGINYSTDGSLTTNKYWGVSNPTAETGYGLGGILMLNNEVTHVRHTSVSNNVWNNTLDWAPFASMDPNYKIQPIKYFTDGVNTLIQACWNFHLPTGANTTYFNQFNTRHWAALNMNSTQLVQNGYLTMCTVPTGVDTTTGPIVFGWRFGFSATANSGTSSFPVYRNPATNNLVWIVQASGTTTLVGQYPYAVQGAATVPIFSAAPTQQQVAGTIADTTNQFLGVSAIDNYSINFRISLANDYTHTIVKYNDGNNTITTLNTFNITPTRAGSGSTGSYTVASTGTIFTATAWTFTGTNVVPPVVGVSTFTGTATYIIVGTSTYLNVNSLFGPGLITQGSLIFSTTGTSNTAYTTSTGSTITAFGIGTNIGGDRTTTLGTLLPKYASKTFADPSTSTTDGFYVPYFDIVGNYQPFYYQWNTLNDTFLQYSDVTMVYATGTSISSYWQPDTLSLTSVASVGYGLQRLWVNETFVSGGNRYLIFMQLHGGAGIFDAYPLMRTFLTYSIDPNYPRKLTYVGNIQVPSSPKNIVWLSNDKTILGVIAHSAFYVYTFTSTAGWTQTGLFPYQFNAVGRDGLGRVWAQDTGIGYGRIHLITLNVPVNIVVTSDASSYYYSGGSTTANLTVNAYSYTGDRIATAVKLVIDGGSMTFAGSNLTLSVTTSASGDTIVPVTITGGGVANIIASASLS